MTEKKTSLNTENGNGGAAERIWPRPVVLPLPEKEDGSPAGILLNGGDWQILRDLSGMPWEAEEGWEPVKVPCQQPASDREYAYRRTFTVPEDMAGSRVFLRFDGVNCDVRVYVGDRFAGSHYGGFVAWDREITDFVTPGVPAVLYVVSRDDPGGVNPFQFGGIIRDVTLFALPRTCLARFHGIAGLDGAYRDGTLDVLLRLDGGDGTVRLSLRDREGREAGLSGETFQLRDGQDVSLSFTVPSPRRWDAEHPCLYVLTAELLDRDGKVTERTSRRIGFRRIEKRGRQIFLNGNVLKLRGVNHHDTDPETGRSITRETAETDVRLFREANVNFVRTSHYPPRPDFLDFCDEYGIYVEDETAVAFLGQGVDCRENDPAFTAKFMDPFAEFLERDLSHPCVILWSLANECFWGTNLALENAYAHAEDPSRLTIFSYPITQKEDDDRADVWSMHYAAWDQAPDALVDSFDRSRHEPAEWPVLHDESTHIPCYARNDLRRDPGIRDFYGETVSRFWDRLWEDEASLGCAIWAGIDDVWEHGRAGRMGPSWGILDCRRRRKPEHWHVRKAFAPVRLRGFERTGDGILLTLENRFNHTDLSETVVRYAAGDLVGETAGPAVPPRETGRLLIPLPDADTLSLRFFDASGSQVQEEEIALRPTEAPERPAAPRPEVSRDGDCVTVSGSFFKVRFSRETGLIRDAAVNRRTVLTGGPALHLTGLALPPWTPGAFSVEETGDAVSVTSTGAYGRVRVSFRIILDGSGRMETECDILDMPFPSPRKVAMRIGDDTDSGGYEETGIRFTLSPDAERFFWRKKGLWSVFPEDHIGRLRGDVAIDARGRLEPGTGAWKDDLTDPLLFGRCDVPIRGSRDLRSLKSGILEGGAYARTAGGGNAVFRVTSDGSDSLRLFFRPAPRMIVDDRDGRLEYRGNWRRMETGFGSLNGTETWSDEEGASCTVRFSGTGIAWIGSTDILGGTAEVILDGQAADPRVMLGTRLQTPGIARGYEKDPQRLLFAREGLPRGPHTLTVRVLGKRTPGSSGAYVFIDHFIVLGEDEEWIPELAVDSAFNYPELSWGCYTKDPVRLSTGDRLKVTACLEACGPEGP